MVDCTPTSNSHMVAVAVAVKQIPFASGTAVRTSIKPPCSCGAHMHM